MLTSHKDWGYLSHHTYYTYFLISETFDWHQCFRYMWFYTAFQKSKPFWEETVNPSWELLSRTVGRSPWRSWWTIWAFECSAGRRRKLGKAEGFSYGLIRQYKTYDMFLFFKEMFQNQGKTTGNMFNWSALWLIMLLHILLLIQIHRFSSDALLEWRLGSSKRPKKETQRNLSFKDVQRLGSRFDWAIGRLSSSFGIAWVQPNWQWRLIALQATEDFRWFLDVFGKSANRPRTLPMTSPQFLASGADSVHRRPARRAGAWTLCGDPGAAGWKSLKQMCFALAISTSVLSSSSKLPSKG